MDLFRADAAAQDAGEHGDGFLEVGRLVAPLEQLAALKVVAIRPTATAWPSPTDSAVEMLVEHAWPQVRLVADKMLAALPQEAADRCSGC